MWVKTREYSLGWNATARNPRVMA